MGRNTDDAEDRFVLWDKKDGFAPRTDDDGNITSDGVLGRVDEWNVYLSTYAQYPGDKRPHQLEVGERIENVTFSLSGSKGTYDVYRVI